MRQIIFFMVWLLLPVHLYAKNIHIVTTIKPIESLVRNIIDDDDTVSSLIENNNSPHHFALKPSHILKMRQSDAFIMINPVFESFVQTTLRVIPETTHLITLVDNAPNMILYPTEYYGVSHKNHHATDYHIWLSVQNAIHIIHYVTTQLSLINPEKKTIYNKNADIIIKKLLDLDAQLKTDLLKIKDIPFMVFHNGYQYFTKAYNLNIVGIITDNPSAYSSVHRIKKAQKQLHDNNVRCIFKEPQFSSKPIETVISTAKTKIAMLDPLGGALASDKNQYFTLMKNLSNNMIDCLSQKYDNQPNSQLF